MTLSTIHYIQIVCGALGAGLPALGTAFPEQAKPYFLATAATLALLATVLGLVSKSATTGGDA